MCQCVFITINADMSCASPTIRSLRPELRWSFQVRRLTEPMLQVISHKSRQAGERSYEAINFQPSAISQNASD